MLVQTRQPDGSFAVYRGRLAMTDVLTRAVMIRCRRLQH